ncbi:MULTISPECIES: hypothetical protein [Cyanophyceae]|nr:hypothetical protein [Trichocoleus sp. FACHB-69]
MPNRLTSSQWEEVNRLDVTARSHSQNEKCRSRERHRYIVQ